jgi:hypothetical protein
MISLRDATVAPPLDRHSPPPDRETRREPVDALVFCHGETIESDAAVALRRAAATA